MRTVHQQRRQAFQVSVTGTVIMGLIGAIGVLSQTTLDLLLVGVPVVGVAIAMWYTDPSAALGGVLPMIYTTGLASIPLHTFTHDAFLYGGLIGGSMLGIAVVMGSMSYYKTQLALIGAAFGAVVPGVVFYLL